MTGVTSLTDSKRRHPIPGTECYVILGDICNDSKYDKDIMRQCNQLYERGNVLFRKFRMCSTDVMINLFHKHFSPMYTAQRWGI